MGRLKHKPANKIRLDTVLIASARRLITGANVHRVKQLIFVYEQSVLLHETGWLPLGTPENEHEQALRNFVMQESLLRSKVSC